MNEIDALHDVMKRLRAPDGCPWDREQTHESLKPNLVEEAAEFLDAVDARDDAAMCEELGDVLMQVVLHAVIAAERGAFTLEEVAREVREKMVRRHPHVFGEERAETSGDVVRLWEQVKQREKATGTDSDGACPSVLDRIPANLPALHRAFQFQKRAAKLGFDWPCAEGVFDKLDEETRELRTAIAASDVCAVDEELGDLLFTAVNLARKYSKTSPEFLLAHANEKFRTRFRHVENRLRESGKTPGTISPDELDSYWNEAKMHVVPQPKESQPDAES